MATKAKSDINLPPGTFMPMASNWCHSVGEFVKTDFEWTIHHFELRNSEYPLESTFSAEDGIENLTWKLSLVKDGIKIAHGIKELHDTFRGRSTYYTNFYGNCARRFRVKTGFVNAKREKVFYKEFLVTEGMEMPVLVNSTPSEILLDKSSNLLVNGNLTIIYCEVETYKDVKSLKGLTKILPYQSFSNKEELMKDFEELFESRKHSDVTFNVGDSEFRAHKTILIARCPVFAAMFDHPTTEKFSGVIDIPDIIPHVFQELLRYIYTGQVPLMRMDEVAVELFAAADKYLLEKLKQECEVHLIKRMTPDNCIRVLAMENCPVVTEHLKKLAEDFLFSNPLKVMATDMWKKMKDEQPTIILNIQQLLLEKLFLNHNK